MCNCHSILECCVMFSGVKLSIRSFNLFRVGAWRIRISPFLHTLENHFKVSIDDEGNLELVLLTVESHEGILFENVYPHRFMVCTIFEVLVFGFLTLKSLETVQAEVVFVLVLAVATRE